MMHRLNLCTSVAVKAIGRRLVLLFWPAKRYERRGIPGIEHREHTRLYGVAPSSSANLGRLLVHGLVELFINKKHCETDDLLLEFLWRFASVAIILQ